MTHHHYLIYKPYGYLSQFVCEHKNKKLLGELFDFPLGIMAIGRLDEDSEGLLLLTTDGRISELIRSRNIEKQYYVQLDGIVTTHAIEKLRQGVDISIQGEKYTTLPCNASILTETPLFPERSKKIRSERHGPTTWISIVLTEGKYRQIRKMTAAVGFPTLRLIRVRIGAVYLNNLKPGEVVELNNLAEQVIAS